MTNTTAESPVGQGILPATATIGARDWWDHVLARLGLRRGRHRVTPGLYALGAPTPESPVLVSANYTLSFDSLRSALAGTDAYLLVLDTRGVNVWCAAGKGTFGTQELVHRIEATRLAEVVDHRKLVLPQLGAPGVAAHEVKERSGFQVRYGPVRAGELPRYLETGAATPAMRRVRFGLKERLVLIPVEVVHVAPLLAVFGALGLLFRRSLGIEALAGITALLAGTVAFPALLPWVPTRDFGSKGFILGAVAAAPFALLRLLPLDSGPRLWLAVGGAMAILLKWAAVTAFVALNFTGSTTFTSRSGVRREMYRYLRAMAAAFLAGLALNVVVMLL